MKPKLVIAMLPYLTLFAITLVESRVTFAQAVVPHLIRFGGNLVDIEGKPLSGTLGVTFSIYKDQTGGAPLWMEVQNVKTDAKGHYVALLGSTKQDGVPLELFISGEAQWLGVRAEGQEEQPRVLLLSVPYALKAADAETLGGKPASAFVQVPAVTEAPSSNTVSHETAASQFSPGLRANIAGGGTANYIPVWTDNNGTLGNSAFYQTANVPIDFGQRVAPSIYFWDNGVAGARYGMGINGGEVQEFFPSLYHMSINFGGDLQPSGTNEMMRIDSSHVKLNGGVNNTGTGIKHVRSTASCTTGNNVGNTCSVTITWPGTAFADTNYTVVCSPEKQIASPYAASWFFIPLGGRTTSTFVVTMETLNSLATSLNSLDCIGIHD
jgi:hypothetical protein